ncbi:hypothetical protein B0H14DRAFT_2664654, partial [Mycena olivaceomarginata]
MWIWRSCSLSVTALPILLVATFYLTVHDFLGSLDVGFPLVFTHTHLRPHPYLSPTHPIHRAAELPPAAFADVNWSVYIPPPL